MLELDSGEFNKNIITVQSLRCQEKLKFLADMSAKAFSPPPGLNGLKSKNVSFFMYKNISFWNKKIQKIPSNFPLPTKTYIS